MLTAKPFPEDDGEMKRIDAVLDKIRALASEHFDVGVVMFSAQSDEGGTSYHGTQFGNKFAVTGMVDAWCNGDFDSEMDIECDVEDDEE